MRILGLDFGTVRLGVALSDEMGWTAQPLEVIKRSDNGDELDSLARIVEEYNVDEIVIGMPFNMDGTVGPMAEAVREFAEDLKSRFELPVREWDERLSSKAAERVLIEGNIRRKKRKTLIDKVSAAMILQGYLDSGDREGK